MLHQEAKKTFQMHCMNTNIKVGDVVNGIGWTKRDREIYRGLFTALSVNKVWHQGDLWLKTTKRLIFAHWIHLMQGWFIDSPQRHYIFNFQGTTACYMMTSKIINAVFYFWTEIFKRAETSDLWEGVIYTCTSALIYYLSTSEVL